MQSGVPTPPISPDRSHSSNARWHALTHRTPSSHSTFLYGVKSTRIYCRPTCSARLARRANVVFYDTEAEAQLDGFRPCKRCKPDNKTFLGESEEVVSRAIALLRIKKDDSSMKRGLRELAKEVGVTPSYLCRVFKRTLGITVGTYMREFEKDPSEADTESSVQSPSTDSSVQSPSTVASSVMGEDMIPLTPATTARSLSVPLDDLKGAPAEIPLDDYDEGALDLDFDYNDWLMTDDVMNYSMDH